MPPYLWVLAECRWLAAACWVAWLGILALVANSASGTWLDVTWACGWKTKMKMRRCRLVCPFVGVVSRLGFGVSYGCVWGFC